MQTEPLPSGRRDRDPAAAGLREVRYFDVENKRAAELLAEDVSKDRLFFHYPSRPPRCREVTQKILRISK